jgi:mRNA-degrading endonuclease HigB of HigAB toxin-antitoxin module
LIEHASAVKTLKDFWEAVPDAKQALLAWYEEAEATQRPKIAKKMLDTIVKIYATYY